MRSTTTPLGQYLRARRELVRPRDVGLTHFGRRRVPGLRREELAMLAGISADYYLRLEQGRDHHPSAQVIEALARALRLDSDATAHLRALSTPVAAARPAAIRERATRSIEQMIATWPMTPAFVHDRRYDILAANALATALSPAFSAGGNLVHAMFLDPAMHDLLEEDWEHVAQAAVARLRAMAGPNLDDPRLGELVDEVSKRSEFFRQCWSRHDIRVSSPRLTRYNHPRVGRLELKPERLGILGTDGQIMIVLHAESGSPSEEVLARLRSLCC